MGLVKLMDDTENGKAQNDYEFTMVTAADELTALVAGNKVDIALLPANVAGVLYNKTKGGISVIDVNTLGVLYLVSSDTSVTSIDQLKGKTVYLTGKGTTPEYSPPLSVVRCRTDRGDVTLEFKSSLRRWPLSWRRIQPHRPSPPALRYLCPGPEREPFCDPGSDKGLG